MKAFWVGTALVALGAAWWAVDAVLTTAFPEVCDTLGGRSSA